MKQWTNDVAPSWCKDAIPTNRGWVNPKTGDIEVASKNLNNPQDYDSVIKSIKSGNLIIEETVKVIRIPVEPFPKESVEVVKRGRGRPKLNKPVRIPKPRGRPKLSKNLPDYNPLEAMLDGI